MSFDANQAAYQELRDLVAERTSRMLAWVGSGLSKDAGLPTWPELRTALVNALRSTIPTLDETGRREKEGLLKAALAEYSPWVAFDILERAIGPESFHAEVRRALTVPDSAVIPDAYKLLWKLHLSGMLSLNLDRLATRALIEVRPGSALPIDFNGFRTDSMNYVLQGPRPFIAHLHGLLEDSGSWVLTRRALSSLLQRPGYKEFIQASLFSHRVVFVGISADDEAVGGLIAALRSSGVNTSGHFWITDKRDTNTDAWANAHGMRLIRYRSRQNDHRELLELLIDLAQYVAPEETGPALPVVSPKPSTPTGPLPEPRVLAKEEPEHIRVVLNQHAAQMLEQVSDVALEQYYEFCQKYDRCIYDAWYMDLKDDANKVFGYTLIEEVAQGAFGRVYKALSPKGEQVAVKVLLDEVRRKPELLNSFRRGVRAMRILGERGVAGMVAYREAYEIPALVVMDWIEGPNLAQAKEARLIEDWDTALEIAVRLASVVRNAHKLPERVLHRDLRPANVMLEGYWTDTSSINMRVLDFDLSWHHGAVERSVIHGSALHGYLAPEQLAHVDGVSTRNAAVDAFGFGMTLFFLCGGKNPSPAQQEHATWKEEIRTSVSVLPEPAWKSLPNRIGRVIEQCTLRQQQTRWDLGQAEGELSLLLQAERGNNVASAELMAEEIAARSGYLESYSWNNQEASAELNWPNGVAMRLRGEDGTGKVHLGLRWTRVGTEDWKSVAKYMGPAMKKASEILASVRWQIVGTELSNQEMRLDCMIGVEVARVDIDRVAKELDRAIGAFRVPQ